MQPMRTFAVAKGIAAPPAKELLSTRVTGFITVLIVLLPILSFFLLDNMRAAPGFVSEPLTAAAVFGFPLCLIWGVMVLRTRCWWGMACIIEGIVGMSALFPVVA